MNQGNMENNAATDHHIQHLSPGKQPSPEKGPPANDWVMLDDTSHADREISILRQQAEIYKEDFYQERRMREEANERTKALEAEVQALREQQSHQEAELGFCREEIAAVEEEKMKTIRKKREMGDDARLLRQQVETLQERLRAMERERRTMGMYMNPAMMTQVQCEWPCPMCTYKNAPDATKCEMCMEPAPERHTPLPPWMDQVVCD